MKWGFWICVWVVLSPMAARADPVPLAKPMPAHVVIRHAPPQATEPVNGMLTAWDDDSLTITTTHDERNIQWTDLTGLSAYELRVQLIDKKNGQAWLKLATLAWELNDTRDGKSALTMALRLDPSTKDDVDAVLASGAGVLLEPGGGQDGELMQDAPADQPAAVPKAFDPKKVRPKYRKSTPAQAKAAIAAVRAEAMKVGDDYKLNLTELETPHFLIYTDWDPKEYKFLQTNMEAAYTVVSRQFDIPVEENVFFGKLSVYMFAKNDKFFEFATKHDNFPADKKDVAGYFYWGGDSFAHMAMYKPSWADASNRKEAEIAWAYVLTHEFTHAFVSRYRSGRFIPTWLNEGVAEVVASSAFPHDVTWAAAEAAHNHSSLADLFKDDAGIQSGDLYPVMRTVVEMLIAKDRRKFLQMFDEIKAGYPAAQALKDNYGCTFAELESSWRQAIARRAR